MANEAIEKDSEEVYMIDTRARKYFQFGFDALAKVCVKMNLSANTITVFALLIGVMAGIMLGLGQRYMALVCMLISGLLDVLDGSVARISKTSSNVGAFLDLIFDRMVEGVIIIGFYMFMPEYALLYILFYIGAMFNFSTFMLAGILFKNEGVKSMHYDIGIVERSETFIAFLLMMLFPTYLPIFLSIFIILMFLTALIRSYKIMQQEWKRGM